MMKTAVKAMEAVRAASLQIGRSPKSSIQLSTLRSAIPSVAHNHCLVRFSSHSPLGLPSINNRSKVTLNTLTNMYKKGEPITMLTASDFPSAHVADHAGMDMVLVGDSLAMVSMGLEDTSEVTVDEMIMHCRSVARAVKTAFTVSCKPSCSE